MFNSTIFCFQSVIWSILFNHVHTLVSVSSLLFGVFYSISFTRWSLFPVCYLEYSIQSRSHIGLCFQSVIWSILFNLVHTLVSVSSLLSGVFYSISFTRWSLFPVCYLEYSIQSRSHIGLCFQSVIWSILFNLVHTLVSVSSLLSGVFYSISFTR